MLTTMMMTVTMFEQQYCVVVVTIITIIAMTTIITIITIITITQYYVVV